MDLIPTALGGGGLFGGKVDLKWGSHLGKMWTFVLHPMEPLAQGGFSDPPDPPPPPLPATDLHTYVLVYGMNCLVCETERNTMSECDYRQLPLASTKLKGP